MSTQVIAYTKSLDFKTLLEIECKALTGFAPVIKECPEDFQAMLGLFPSIEVLVIEEPQAPSDYKFLLEALAPREDSISNILILSSGSQLNLKKSKNFPAENVGSLIEHLKGLLNHTASQEGYISVPIDSLVHFKIVPFDLFIKVGEKYIKRIHANEDIDADAANSLKQKGVQDFYFERKYNKDFSLMLLNNMINKVEMDYTSDEDKLKAKSEVFHTTKEIVRSVGLPPRVIQVCESVMESITVEVTKSKDRLGTYLNTLKGKADVDFQFRFIELTSFIATQMVDQLNLGTKAEDTKTVVFAAFFCDISLKDHSLLELTTEESLKELFPEDRKEVEEHALRSSQIVAKYKNAPELAATLVKEHHGAMDGVGFPSVIPKELHPLSKVLIAAHEVSLAILRNGEAPVVEVVGKLAQKHQGREIHPLILRFQESCQNL